MVGVTQQRQVVQIAPPAVGPVDDVVGLALRRPAVAAADDALLVAGGQSAPLGLGDGPGESAQVQPLEIRVEVDGADIGVAQQPE